jgi:glycosyltransferase involved in cell wall biosynthesis
MAASETHDRPIRLAHIAGQPAPSAIALYRRLTQDPRVDLTVFYGSADGVRPFDDGYGTPVAWDSDLTSGYRCVFLRAADRTPGLGDHFWATRNWDIVPALIRGRFDVLWTAGYYSATYVMATLAQRARGGQVLFREEQTLLDPRSLRNVIAKQLTLRPFLRLGSGLFISTENRRWLQSFGVPDERLFPAPYTVDNAHLQAEAQALAGQRDQVRSSLGIPPGDVPVIATVSRLIPKKQPLFMLEAFRRARERVRCVLLIVGSGPLEQQLREHVRAQQIPDVVFAGFLNRSSVARAYAAADVFSLLSAERETFGLVVNEALNFGLPAVVSDRVGCAPDLVWNGVNGYVVSARDPAEAAVAFERLAGDASLRARMGAASRERIDAWSVDRSAAGIIQAATMAVGGGR